MTRNDLKWLQQWRRTQKTGPRKKLQLCNFKKSRVYVLNRLQLRTKWRLKDNNRLMKKIMQQTFIIKAHLQDRSYPPSKILFQTLCISLSSTVITCKTSDSNHALHNNVIYSLNDKALYKPTLALKFEQYSNEKFIFIMKTKKKFQRLASSGNEAAHKSDVRNS